MFNLRLIFERLDGTFETRLMQVPNVMRRFTSLIIFFYVAMSYAAGDPKAGQDKSLVCSACHGAKGISLNPEWPSLAGQHATYIIKQLRDFKQGDTRNAPTMSPMAANLTEQDIEDLAAYYAMQPANNDKALNHHAEVRGETLYRQGDLSKHITACIACHGPDAKGNEEAGFPKIGGQSVLYTIQQLQAFKAKKRRNDLHSIMRDICSHLDEEDIKAIARYLKQKNAF